ncbi:hypothetical protein D3C75_1075310 [compost metagenome]
MMGATMSITIRLRDSSSAAILIESLSNSLAVAGSKIQTSFNTGMFALKFESSK